MRQGLVGLSVVVILVGGYLAIRLLAGEARAPIEAAIVVPELSPRAVEGERLFETFCASCHGQSASGTQVGPPLVHDIYKPGHHADVAFLLAARQGVRQHHWNFGDMPPVEGVSGQEVERITAYVRALQEANDIN
ncbi:c-type cytochrome [Afifella pfennigii]|uniref:c-type cytochrome n=1 Tax=Afifella pfennigii TaxID=209897 RepID=UPI00047C673A|nr:cytochrome c [Afifella pfennigii]